MAEFKIMSPAAVNVSVVAAAQVTAPLTKISPVSLPLAGEPTVVMLTPVNPRLFWRVVAPMPLTVWGAPPAEMVKSVGSSNHVPAVP